MNKKWIIDEQERDDIKSVVVMAKRLKPGLSEIRALDRGRLIHIGYTRYRTESLYEVCYYYDGDLIIKLSGHEIDIFEGVDKTGVETIDIILTSNIDGGTVDRSISFTMSGMGKGGIKRMTDERISKDADSLICNAEDISAIGQFFETFERAPCGKSASLNLSSGVRLELIRFNDGEIGFNASIGDDWLCITLCDEVELVWDTVRGCMCVDLIERYRYCFQFTEDEE